MRASGVRHTSRAAGLPAPGHRAGGARLPVPGWCVAGEVTAVCLALGLLASLLVVPAALAAPARLALTGWPGGGREGESLLQSALRAPGDSLVLDRALGEAIAVLQDEGWLDARSMGAWTLGAQPQLAVRVTPGVRYHWPGIALDAGPGDSLVFAAALVPASGTIASPGALRAGIERAVRDAEAAGYAWAQLGVSAWAQDSGVVHVRLRGTRGPRVQVSQTRVDGLSTTRADVAQRALGKLVGHAFDPVTARAGTQRLEQLGVFSHVEYLGLAGGGDWQQGILRWRVSEPRYNTFEGAIGVQGSAGLTGLAHLELGNLAGTARAMGLTWRSRGKGLSDFSARYGEPLVMGLPLKLELALSQQIQDTLYSRFRYGAKGRVALSTGQRWEAGFEEERVVQPHGVIQEADLQNTTFALERDQRDDALAPRRGTRVRVGASQVFKRETLRATTRSAAAKQRARSSAAEAHLEWHRATGARSGVALEASGAARFSDQRVLPDWERYPEGGAASLRGHAEEEFKVDRYALTRLEYRWFLDAGTSRASLFWDHAFLQSRDALTDANGVVSGDVLRRRQADGVGFGLRLPVAAGVVDLDYGIAPGRGFLEGKIHLQLVTAF